MLRAYTRVSKPVANRVASSLRTFATENKEYTVTLPDNSFEYYELDEFPNKEVHTSRDKLLEMYREMVIIRRMEMEADRLYKAKEIRGFCHLSTGQEAVAVGIEEATDRNDAIITSYRCHGFCYTRGASISSIIGELMGKANGVSKGKGGSMHMFAKNFFGGNGIVGAQVPMGLGLGFAHQYRKEKNACFTLYGDGAANQGQVFESFNMAKLWKVPVIFACENNKYGMGTSASRSSALTEYYKRGQYIPGLKINGMDVLACYEGSRFAREWCISGKGPLVVEFETYRYGGHSMSDPGTTYRTREEIQNMRSHHDSITGLKLRILELEAGTEEELKKIEKEARAFVEKEVEIAEKAPFPEVSPTSFYTDVYVPGTEPELFRGRIPSENFSLKNATQ